MGANATKEAVAAHAAPCNPHNCLERRCPLAEPRSRDDPYITTRYDYDYDTWCGARRRIGSAQGGRGSGRGGRGSGGGLGGKGRRVEGRRNDSLGPRLRDVGRDALVSQDDSESCVDPTCFGRVLTGPFTRSRPSPHISRRGGRRGESFVVGSMDMAAIAGAGSRGGGAFRQSRRKILGDGNGCERCGLSAFHAAAARPAEKTMGSAIRGKKARVVAGKVEQGLEAIVPETGFEDDRRMAEEEAAPGPNNRGARRGVDTTIRKSNDDDLTKPWAGRGDAGGTSGRSIGQSSRGSSGRSSGSGSGSGSALCSSSSAQDTPVMLTRAASSPSLTTCSFPNSSPSPLPFMSASPPRSPSPFPSPRCPSPCAHSARTRTSPEGFSPPSPPSSPGAQPSCLGACRLLPRARGPTKSAGRPPSGWRAGGAVTEALPRWHAGAAGLDLRGEGSGVEGLVDGWRLDEIQRVAGGCFFAERRTLAEGGIGAEERGRGGDGRSLRDSRRGEWFAGRLVGESVRFMGDHVRSLGDSWAGGRRGGNEVRASSRGSAQQARRPTIPCIPGYSPPIALRCEAAATHPKPPRIPGLSSAAEGVRGGGGEGGGRGGGRLRGGGGRGVSGGVATAAGGVATQGAAHWPWYERGCTRALIPPPLPCYGCSYLLSAGASGCSSGVDGSGSAHGLRRGGKGMVREGCVADENAWEESGEEMDGARQLEEGWGEDEDAGESEEEEGEEKEEEEKEEEEEEEEEWWMHHPRPQTPMMLLEWQDLVVGEMGDEEKEAAGFWRSGGGVLGGGAGSGSRSGRRRRESGSEWGDGTESWREGSMECDLVEEERGDLQREQSDAAVREAAGTGSHDGKSWLGPPM